MNQSYQNIEELIKKGSNKVLNNKYMKQLNQTVDFIAQKVFQLEQKDKLISRYSNSMLVSARTTPQFKTFSSRQKQGILRVNQLKKKIQISSNHPSQQTMRKVHLQSSAMRYQKQKQQIEQIEKNIKVSQNLQFLQQKNNIYSKSVGVQFFKASKNRLSNSTSYKKEDTSQQLFLTMPDGFRSASPEFSSQLKKFQNDIFKMTSVKLKTNRKWTFQEFLNNLYIQKSKDLKTKSNLKQQNLFVQRFKDKFICYDYDEISTFIEYDNTNNFIIKKINAESSDFGVNSIKCICQYLLSKKIRRVSMTQNYTFCNVRSINLSKNPLGDQSIIILSQIFSYFKYLQQLSLISVGISPKSAKPLLKSLIGHQSLKYIDFSSAQGLNRNRFGQSIKQLELIVSNQLCKWEYLNLNNINFGDNGLNLISNGINKGSTIKEVYFSQNDIKSSQIQYFLSKFKVTNLKILDLSNNSIGDQGLKLISQIIGHQYGHNTLSSSLQILNVSNNQIRSYGMESFCKNMINNQCLVEINLANNQLSKGQKFFHIKYFISKNWTLKRLILNNCFSDSNDLRHLFEGLQDNRALEVLDVSKNKLGIDQFEYLAKMLSQNKGLRSLSLESCNIGDRQLQKNEKELNEIKNLQQINLGNNFISDKSSKLILSILSKCRSIAKVVLTKNSLGIKTLEQIEMILKNNRLRKEQTKQDERQLEYLNYVSSIQASNEQQLQTTIQKLQRKQEKVKYTSLICQLVKAEMQEDQKKKELHDQIMKIRHLQQKIRKGK